MNDQLQNKLHFSIYYLTLDMQEELTRDFRLDLVHDLEESLLHSIGSSFLWGAAMDLRDDLRQMYG